MRFAPDGFRERHRARSGRRHRAPQHLEVVIHRHLPCCQRHDVAIARLCDMHGVIAAGDDLQRQAGVDVRLQRCLVTARRGGHGRRDQ